MISEREDDRSVVIQGDEEGRHLWEGEHQGGGHARDETGARHGQGGRGQISQDQVQQDQGHQWHRGEQVDGQEVEDETERKEYKTFSLLILTFLCHFIVENVSVPGKRNSNSNLQISV